MDEPEKSTTESSEWPRDPPVPRILLDKLDEVCMDEQLIAIAWTVAQMIGDYSREHHLSIVSDFHQELMLNLQRHD